MNNRYVYYSGLSESFQDVLSKHGWQKSSEKYPDATYQHDSYPGHQVFLEGSDSTWSHATYGGHSETGLSHVDLDAHLSKLHRLGK